MKTDPLPWLCRLGLHRWTKEPLPYILQFDRIQVCQRCGWGRRDELKGVAFCWLSPREVQHYRDLEAHAGVPRTA